MIEAKSLRIGNWFNYEDEPMQWEMDDFRNMEFDSVDCIWQQIPLTEEWHNKFGVEINGHMSYVYELPRNNNIRVKIVFTGDYVYLVQGDKPMEQDVVAIWNTDLTKRDMFVHEFQNLYSLLSGGEELTILKRSDRGNVLVDQSDKEDETNEGN